MRPANPPLRPPLDDDAVAEFLANNSDFLMRRPELMPDPAPTDNSATGAVVSLAERQVAVLRERNEALRDRLTTLMAVARDNDRTFARMRALMVALMDAANVADLDRTLAERLLQGFQADHATCFVRRAAEGDLQHVRVRLAMAPWDRLFDAAEPSCGTYRAAEYELLFGAAQLSGPASVAVVPLQRAGAALAIGSKDPQRFAPDMGKMYLTFLGDVLERTLTRLKL